MAARREATSGSAAILAVERNLPGTTLWNGKSSGKACPVNERKKRFDENFSGSSGSVFYVLYFERVCDDRYPAPSKRQYTFHKRFQVLLSGLQDRDCPKGPDPDRFLF